jgi:hypothetical protein
MGDIDGDGFVDLLAGSAAGDGLFWYAYPSWTKHRIASGSFTTDMQVGDVDGDGDLDIVAGAFSIEKRDAAWVDIWINQSKNTSKSNVSGR